MKKLLYPLLIAILISCGSKEATIESIIATNDLKSIRAKKNELNNKQQSIIAQIKQLDAAIAKASPNKNIPLVTAYAIKDTLFNHYIELQGNLETKQNLVLTPKFAGLLTEMYVKEGQYVKKGQALAKVDDGGLSLQVSQLEIQTALAKTTFERQERLWNQKIGSEIQYLQAKTSYEAQQKAVDQLKTTLSKTIITAPFSGTIDNIITEKGNVVSPGVSQILRIVNLDKMYVQVDVPERYISTIKKGTSTLVDIPVLGKTYPSKIDQSSNFINPVNRTYTIDISIPNTEKLLKPNLTARLKINDYLNEKAILIPQSLISENSEGSQYVYTVGKNNKNENIAIQKTIKTGKSQGSLVEVLTGITVGDLLIQEGARSVKNEQPIQVLN